MLLFRKGEFDGESDQFGYESANHRGSTCRAGYRARGGSFVTARMPEFGAAVGNLLTAIWQAFSHIVHNVDWDVDLQGAMTGLQSEPALIMCPSPYPGDPTG
jgi:hypothetical protein